MKRRMSVPAAAILRMAVVGLSLALVMAATGCDRKEPDKVTMFDPQIDAPAGSLTVVVDANLAADQKRISDDMLDRMAAAAPQPEVEEPAVVAAEEEEEEPAATGRSSRRRNSSRSRRSRRRR